MKCVRCGLREAVHEGLCEYCILELHPPLPPGAIRLVVCPVCGSFRVGGRWQEIPLEEAVLREVEQLLDPRYALLGGEVKVEDSRVRLRLTLDVYGKRAEWEGERELRIRKEVCDRCSRRAGGYYEAIIQLRGAHAEEAANVAVREVESHPSRMAFVTKVEWVRGGVDVYVGDRAAARRAARVVREAFGGEYKESSSLYGRRDGRELRRSTYLVRTPEFGPGDVVELGGRRYVVEAMGREFLLRDAWSGALRKERWEALREARLLAKAEDVVEGEIFYVGEGVAHVYDPESGELRQLPAPPWARRGKVLMVRVDDEIILIPGEAR